MKQTMTWEEFEELLSRPEITAQQVAQFEDGDVLFTVEDSEQERSFEVRVG